MNDTKIIDFQKKFMEDFISWSNRHPEIAQDEDKLEIAAQRAKSKWYATEKSWLNGISPNEYFFNINDAGMYITLFISYIEEGRYIPEPLLDCIIDSADDTYSLLINIMNIDSTDDLSQDVFTEVRAKIVALIEEMRMPHPYSRYITIILQAQEQSELTESIATAFIDADDVEFIRSMLLSAYELTSGYSRLFFLDILSSFPDDDSKVADILLKELACDNIELSTVAKYEAAIMDERAVPLLREYLEDASIDYYTYSQLRYALEAITGDLIEEKDFSGDINYDKIAGLKEEDIFG